MKTSKILYGQVQHKSDFDYIARIKGTQTRIAQKGKEWFLLDAKMRVMIIADNKEAARGAYRTLRYFTGHFRLHNIEAYNHGRCSKAKCKEIFDSLKRKS